ncbi:MAG: D-cysteine desulfhydrase family protein [Chloroflexi bacterium]|nr:D-cysteine desulfhydrase family protein [Chloroflexota bacterium]
MLGASLPRVPLAQLPTPVARLTRLSSALGGPELLVKRDDQTGLAFGGNKARKLELLVAEAEARGARTLVTRGAVQSNHCRQTAAAAAARGLQSILVLRGEPPASANGNLLLDSVLGARVVWTHGQDPQAVLEETFTQAEAEGRRPYLVPYGGSSPLGASAYALALEECLAQVTPDWIVLASSSGGTQAGLVAGARLLGFGGRILGISVDLQAAALQSEVARLATAVCALLGRATPVEPPSILVEDRFAAPGYAALTSLEREAISAFARQEGILLDPVYTGRSAGGLLALAREGRFASGERVLFWHTGGTPALFAYAAELASA